MTIQHGNLLIVPFNNYRRHIDANDLKDNEKCVIKKKKLNRSFYIFIKPISLTNNRCFYNLGSINFEFFFVTKNH
ncbi:hypothetical protein V1478_018231 [Vespula squamosa]|uniref:Uncharacterized protein n=1 Tax=Vespula squamosa TaxID=30214 RepID=A0ABD1ZUU1_VESSQ